MGIGVVEIITVCGVVAVVLIGVMGVVATMLIATFRGGKHRGSRVSEAQETQLIQEIHRGLTRMEERIEALETLMLDQGKKTAGAKQD